MSRIVLLAVVAVVVTAALVWVGYRSLRGGGHAAPSPSTHHPAIARTSAGAQPLQPADATGFNDNREDAGLAIDNNPATAWSTSWYKGNPVFGGLKNGSGLILDMGRSVRLSSVQVTFGFTPGADVEIKIGNSNAQSPATDNAPDHSVLGEQTANAMTTVASRSGVSGTVTFPVSSTATGRYVLIWFTKLPPWTGHPDKFLAEIFNVVVKGSS